MMSIQQQPRVESISKSSKVPVTVTGAKKRSLDKDVIIQDNNKKPKINDTFSTKLISQMVRSALDSLDENDFAPIDTLNSQISLPPSNPQHIPINNLSILIKFLSSEISRLDHKSTYSLIQTVLKINWISNIEHNQFNESYSTFLTVLVSGIPRWWKEVASRLISDFIKKPPSKLTYHHETLRRLILLSPTSTNILPTLLQDIYPNKNALKSDIINYVKNLLHLLTYYDEMCKHVWSLIIQNMIKLDVELQNEIDEVDDDDLSDALESDDEPGLSDNDLSDEENDDDDDENDDENDDNDDEGDDEIHQELSKTAINGSSDSEDEELFDSEEEYHVEIKSISELSSKLDSLLEYLLKYLTPQFSIPSLESGKGVKLFNTLTTIFRTHILPTHYTRSTQYILFYVAQLQPELTDSFLILLFEVVFNSSETIATRVKAMQYVSSFTARAKSLTKEQLISVVNFLTQYCTAFVTEREDEIGDGGGGMERFKTLYCIFQGLLYIICFRHSELRNENGEWEAKLDKFFSQMIVSKFDLLKWCNETVVLIFARISQKAGLCYCFSIIERIKRDRLNGIRGDSGVTKGTLFASKQEFLDLEAYFPFDPLLLKKSKKIVKNKYVEWESVEESDDSE